MNFTSKVLTLVLPLCSFHLNAAPACEEVVLGNVGMEYWRDSIGNGVRGEFVRQLNKKDDLFEKLEPEIEFDLNPYLDLELTFSRNIKSHLPKPNSGRIAAEDFFSFKVQNKLDIEFRAQADESIFFTGANAGVNLVHSSDHISGQKNESTCDIYRKLIDLDTQRGQEFYKGICTTRKKNFMTKFYEDTVNFFSQKIGSALYLFSDSEKQRKYAEDPLAALKVHSLLGIPLDPEVFFENNQDLAIGDIVEHTSYYGITPLGIDFDLFQFVGPSYSRYYRVFRTLTFKKGYGNKVVAEVTDTVVSGNDIEIYKIRPKILKFIKLNFGKWNISDFNQESLVQRFEIDLNHVDGIRFFKKFLFSAYTPKFDLNKESVLIDYSEYKDGVKAQQPVLRSGEGFDNNLVLKFPEVLDFQDREHENIDHVYYEDQHYTEAQKFRKRETEFKLGFLGLSEIDKKFECKLGIIVNQKIPLKDGADLKIDCFYTNAYLDAEQATDLKDYLMMISNARLSEEHQKTITSLADGGKQKVQLATSLNLSAEGISHLVNVSEEEIYAQASKLFFGEDSQNVFSKRHHSKWLRARPVLNPNADLATKFRTQDRTYKTCADMFYKLGITEDLDPKYNDFQGIVGHGLGIDAYKPNRCYRYFTMVKDMANKILEVQDELKKSTRLKDMLQILLDLNKVGFAQVLIARLSGGYETPYISYNYLLTSPVLDSVVVGGSEHQNTTRSFDYKKSLSSELESQYHPRIKDIKYKYNECQPDVLIAEVRLNYYLENRNDIYGEFVLTSFSYAKDKPISTHHFPFSKMIKNIDNQYIARIQLDEPLRRDIPHTMYFELQNEEGIRLSIDKSVYLKEIDSLFSFSD